MRAGASGCWAKKHSAMTAGLGKANKKAAISQSTHAQREHAETFVAKINLIVYHGALLDKGF